MRLRSRPHTLPRCSGRDTGHLPHLLSFTPSSRGGKTSWLPTFPAKSAGLAEPGSCPCPCRHSRDRGEEKEHLDPHLGLNWGFSWKSRCYEGGRGCSHARLLPGPQTTRYVKFGLLFRGWARQRDGPTPAPEDRTHVCTPGVAGPPSPKPLVWSPAHRKPPVELAVRPRPQQSVSGTDGSGALEPQSLSVNKTKQKPSGPWCLLASSPRQLAGTASLWLPCLRDPLWPRTQLAAPGRTVEFAARS